MNPSSLRLAEGYLTALRKHLSQADQCSLGMPLRLGRQAVAIGVQTLDLARIHEQALVTLLLPGGLSRPKAGNAKQAGIFFAAVNAAIEEHRRAPGRSEADFVRLEAALRSRTKELAAANHQRRAGAAQRKTMEEANEKRRGLHKQCLAESLRLEKRLRRLTHRVLAAQEENRGTISRQLQNEIAQTLFGINVRLLALQKEAWGRTKRFKKDIASTRRVLVASATSVRRAVRKFVSHEPQAPDLVPSISTGAENPSDRGRPGKPGGSTRVGK